MTKAPAGTPTSSPGVALLVQSNPPPVSPASPDLPAVPALEPPEPPDPESVPDEPPFPPSEFMFGPHATTSESANDPANAVNDRPLPFRSMSKSFIDGREATCMPRR